MSVPRLRGKASLISGGARGIGAATARLFAKEGAAVAIGDILEQEGGKLAEEITETGADAFFVRLEVTSEKDWDLAIWEVVSRYGKLDVLVNNAAIYQRANVEETSSESWDRVMDVNAKGTFLGTKAAIPAMRASGGGSIVNISSTSGIIGTAVATAYPSSKGAVRLLTKSTAIQYAREGIRANSVHPAGVMTYMLPQVLPTPEQRKERLSSLPLGRFATPEEIAYGVLFLASGESSFVTGSELVIDGGKTAQ